MTKTTGSKSGNKSLKEDSWEANRWLLLVPFWAVILVQCLGCLFPGRLTWGFDYWSLFGVVFSPAALALAFVLASTVAAGFIARIVGLWLKPLTGRNSRTTTIVLSTLGLLAAGILFYLLRSRAHVYGDGFSALSKMSDLGETVFCMASSMCRFSLSTFTIICLCF